MIGRLHGVLETKTPGRALVNVGGVGYDVVVSLQAFARLPAAGSPVSVEVVCRVRDEAIELYGFLDPLEKALFGWLQSVSGVGPRLALNVLSGLPAADLRHALAEGDAARLRLLPGVGKKTAERLVLELRERAARASADEIATSGAIADGGTSVAPSGSDTASLGSRRDEEVLSALVNLGYRRTDAERVVAALPREASLEDALREALRRFAR